ncbi:MAG TPA: hypothetical protein VFQ37_03260, partial [Mycobacterium sp.]|nr:hypothetical protein [Mycobacterium sp.]
LPDGSQLDTVETPAPFPAGPFLQGLIDFYKNTGLLGLDEWIAKTFFGWTTSDAIDYGTCEWWGCQTPVPAPDVTPDVTAAATAADPTEHVGLIAQVLDALGLGAA